MEVGVKILVWDLAPYLPSSTGLCPSVQREGLTSAKYSTQNFKSSEEPSREQKKTCVRIG
jgi:hypothetical protein